MFRTAFSSARYDAIVVGARCAGAATAMLLARAGAKVLLVDRDARGADALSTHALMRPAVAQLHRWGLLGDVVASGAPAATRMTFHYGDETIPIEIKKRDGIAGLYAPRRRVLDRILVDAAVAAGAETRFGVTFRSLKTDGAGRVVGAHLGDREGRSATARADLVIGADGRVSSVAEAADARVERQGRSRAAVVYGYFAGVENQGYRWRYRPGWSAGAIPTHDGLHCVFACVRPEDYGARFRGDPLKGLLKLIAETDRDVAEALYAAGPQDRLRRFAGAPGFLRRAHGPGWALVGDSGYFKDPITAHGISDAFLDAERLAAAYLSGGEAALAGYQAERDRLARPMLAVTDAIAALDWDLEEVKRLHEGLRRCMQAELAAPPRAPTKLPLAA